MGRIVAYVHHYMPRPRKRKAVALEMPTVAATKKSRRPAERATAEAIPRSPRLQDEAPQPSTVRDAECDSAVTIPLRPTMPGSRRSSPPSAASGSLQRPAMTARHRPL